MDKRILYNAVKCENCESIIISKHGHDYVTCECKDTDNQVSVDGGQNYLRRTFGKNAKYTDISVEDDNKHITRREFLRWGVNYDKDMNRLPETEWRCIKDLNTDHIQAIIDGNYTAGNKYYEDVFKEELKYRDKNGNN